VESSSSRRRFLRAGIALPAALSSLSPVTAAGIPYRVLGKTGLKVAPVGFGVGFTPDPTVIARSIDMGVNYFDTARIYGQGNSERLLGEAARGRRGRVIIASKTASRSKTDAIKDMDASLQALGTDYLDIWLLHAKDTPDGITDELVEAQEAAKKQGKARFIGVSTHDPNAVVDRVLAIGSYDVVVLTYSYPMGTTRDASIERLGKAGIGLVAMKVVVATAGFTPPGRGAAGPKPRLEGEAPLAAIKWALKNPLIAVTIPYMADIEQLEMNVRAMTEPFRPADEKALFARSEEIRPYYCRMCYSCKGRCPNGIPVADEIRFLAYNDFCEDYIQARLGFSSLPAEVRAVRCEDCGNCAIECPNGVRVRERLIRAQRLLA